MVESGCPIRSIKYVAPGGAILKNHDKPAAARKRHPGRGGRLVLTLDAMHNEEWTQRAVMGWEAELGKLADALER